MMTDNTTRANASLASDDLFYVAPLKWKKNARTDWCQSWWAQVPMGSYTIERHRSDQTHQWENWKLKWCFDKYYDEGRREVESLADGKRQAFKDWMDRLRPALIPHNAWLEMEKA